MEEKTRFVGTVAISELTTKKECVDFIRRTRECALNGEKSSKNTAFARSGEVLFRYESVGKSIHYGHWTKFSSISR